MKQIAYLVIVSVLSFSCNIKGKADLDVSVVNINLNTKKNNFQFNQQFLLKETITLETNKQSSLGNIESLLVFADRIFIADDNEKVFIFTHKGEHINTLSTGRAPGEFPDILDIQYDKTNEELYAWSLLKKQMYIYTKDGIFKRTVNIDLPIVKFLLIDNFKMIGYSNYMTSTNSRAGKEGYYQVFHLERENTSWKVILKELVFSGKIKGQIISAFGTTNFCNSTNCYYFLPPFRTGLYKIDTTINQLEEIIHFNFGAQSIPDNFIEQEGCSRIFERLTEEGYMLGWGNFYISDDLFCFNTMLHQKEKTVIFSLQEKEAIVMDQLVDSLNELPLHFVSNISEETQFISISNPFELEDYKFYNENSIGNVLASETDKFDNPILVIYEEQ